MNYAINSVALFSRKGILDAKKWNARIIAHLKAHHPTIRITRHSPDAVIILGGDGTILHAAHVYADRDPILFGLNLGTVGFLAAVREPKRFLRALDTFLSGDFRIVSHMMLSATVFRNRKAVFTADALNDAAIQNPLGMVEIKASIESHALQYIRGSGVLVSTATGSTAYNLSAHGPIVMPEIECFLLTELLDHNIPTPTLVIKHDKTIVLDILHFRKRGLLSVKDTKTPFDVMLAADSETIFPLEIGDQIRITRSPRSIRFAEVEKNYFLKSLREKFAFE